jgi:hypothetical protein
MSGKSRVEANFQSETEVMEEIFKGSPISTTSPTQWYELAGHAIAESLMLGNWSIQYESDSASR